MQITRVIHFIARTYDPYVEIKRSKFDSNAYKVNLVKTEYTHI